MYFYFLHKLKVKFIEKNVTDLVWCKQQLQFPNLRLMLIISSNIFMLEIYDYFTNVEVKKLLKQTFRPFSKKEK